MHRQGNRVDAPLPLGPQIFPEDLLTRRITTSSIREAMGSPNCQATFDVPPGGEPSAYASVLLDGCRIQTAGTYVVAVRTASSTVATGFAYWTVGDGAAPQPNGAWSYGRSKLLTDGTLTDSPVGSLQIHATS